MRITLYVRTLVVNPVISKHWEEDDKTHGAYSSLFNQGNDCTGEEQARQTAILRQILEI